MEHDLFVHETWLIHTWDMTHIIAGARQHYLTRHSSHSVCEISHLYNTWLIHVRDIVHAYGTWLIYVRDIDIHTRDMTHISAGARMGYLTRHGLHSVCEKTWFIWNMAHSCMGHDPFIHGTWLIYTRDMTHSYLGNDTYKHKCEAALLDQVQLA